MLLIRFLILFICLLYLLRMIGRLLLPALFRGVVNKAWSSRNNPNPNQNTRSHAKEGTVKVDFIPPNAYKSAVPDSEGEFVKYEEIK